MDEQYQPQQPTNQKFQPPPLQGEPLQPSQSNKNIWIYIIVGLIVAGGAFGFWWWQRGGLVPTLPTPDPSVGSEQAPTDNWQTYRNKQYGFEFKYPRDWDLTTSIEHTDMWGDYYVVEVADNKHMTQTDYGQNLTFWTVSVVKDRFNSSINTLMSTYNSEIQKLPRVVTKEIDNLTTYVIEGITGSAYQDFLVVFYNGYVFNLTGPKSAGASTSADVQNTLSRILSTFKFMSSTSVDIIKKVENWSLYTTTSLNVGTGDCGNKDFESFLHRTNNGSKKAQTIDGLTLIYTPNYLNWSNQKFVDFNKDGTAFCGVGGIYPLHAYADKLLWMDNCGGVLPDDFVERQKVLTCEQTEKVIKNNFK